METKKCLACGQAMPKEADQCPFCHLAGQNQLFLSREDYKTWEEQVLLPHRRALQPQVFAGPDRLLILLGNGDLYAMGHNRSEALGEGLPPYLEKPIRIAQGVRHAAANRHHTLLTMGDGSVRLLGNSEFVDRFQCDVPIEKVYAQDVFGEPVFKLLGQDGQWYGLGRNGGRWPFDKEFLRELPPLAVSGEQKKEWYWTHEGYTKTPSYREFQSIRVEDLPETPRNAPEWKELWNQVRREEWYREYAREYGEANVQIDWLGPVRKEMIECCPVEETDFFGNKTSVFERNRMQYIFQPWVVRSNEHIYQASPYEEKNPTPHIFLNCEPLGLFSDKWKRPIPEEREMRRRAKKALEVEVPYKWYFRRGLMEGFKEDSVENCRLYIDEENQLWAYSDYRALAEPFQDVVDCAAASDSTGKYHQILLVTGQGQVLLGSLEKLYRHRNWNHLETLTF